MLTRGKYKAATTERHMRPCRRLWSAHATDYESLGGRGGRPSGLRDRREERGERTCLGGRRGDRGWGGGHATGRRGLRLVATIARQIVPEAGQNAIHCAWWETVPVTRDTYEGRSEQGKALSKKISTGVSWREKKFSPPSFFKKVSTCHVSQEGTRRQRGYSPRPTFDRSASRRSHSRHPRRLAGWAARPGWQRDGLTMESNLHGWPDPLLVTRDTYRPSKKGRRW